MLSILQNCQIIDLSHELREQNPTWSGGCGFRSQVDMDYDEAGCRVMSYSLVGGVGTHMDAPTHFSPNHKDIASLDVKKFFAPLCVIRVSPGVNQDFLILPTDVLDYENQYGTIPTNSLVVADTGWAKHWSCCDRYRNPDSEGQMHFPGFSIEAAKLLLKRDVVGIGIDTLSPDGGNTDFPVHHLLLPNGKYIIENMVNLEKVPESGSWVVALPPKIKNGAEAPCRCLALVPPS